MMKKAIRPAIFKWRQTEPALILCAVRWYLRYSLSFRDVEELLSERGLEVDHTTIWHWVQRYGPELEERLRHHLKPTNKSWRADETYVRVKGRWCCLYRAIDSSGATIDFVLSRWRDAATATRLFRKALTDPSHPQPRVINTDQARLYGSAIAGVKKAGILRRRCRHRPVQYLNNIVEQDHRAIKRRVTAKQGFRAFHAARRTIQFSSSKSCSGWLHETAPARPDPSLSCLFLKVATHPALRRPGPGRSRRARAARRRGVRRPPVVRRRMHFEEKDGRPGGAVERQAVVGNSTRASEADLTARLGSAVVPAYRSCSRGRRSIHRKHGTRDRSKRLDVRS